MSTINPYQSPTETRPSSLTGRWGPRRTTCAVMCGLSLLWAVPMGALVAVMALGFVQSRSASVGFGSIGAEEIRFGFSILVLAAACFFALLATHRFGREQLADANGYLALSIVTAIVAAFLL